MTKAVPLLVSLLMGFHRTLKSDFNVHLAHGWTLAALSSLGWPQIPKAAIGAAIGGRFHKRARCVCNPDKTFKQDIRRERAANHKIRSGVTCLTDIPAL